MRAGLIQLCSGPDPEANLAVTRAFLREAADLGLGDQVYVRRSLDGSTPHWYLLYGAFASRGLAARDASALPPAMRRQGYVVRKLSSFAGGEE